MYLADTTFLIDLVQNEEGAAKTAQKIDDMQVQVFISSITVQEYLRGVYYLFSENKDILTKKLFNAESDLARFGLLQIDYQIAKKAAEIDAKLTIKGRQIGFADVIIAATAMTFNLRLITKNANHFKRIDDLIIEKY